MPKLSERPTAPLRVPADPATGDQLTVPREFGKVRHRDTPHLWIGADPHCVDGGQDRSRMIEREDGVCWFSPDDGPREIERPVVGVGCRSQRPRPSDNGNIVLYTPAA